MSEISTSEKNFRIDKSGSEKKRKTNKENLETLVFPDGVQLLARNKKEIKKLHKASADVWDDAYDYEEILEIANVLEKDAKSRKERKKIKAKLSKKKKNELKQKGVKLKDVVKKKDRGKIKGKISKKERKKLIKRIVAFRKVGSWNRSMWEACDKKHKTPKKLNKLIVQMGNLKDFPGEEVKYANKVKKALKKYDKNKKKIDKKFKACSSKSFRKKLRNTEQIMISILKKQKPRQVEIGHDLRKEGTRFFLNLYTSKLYLDSNAKHKGVLQNIRALDFFYWFDDELGTKHDIVIKKIREGKKAKMKIDDEMRTPLINGLEKQAKQWDEQIKKENKKSQKNNKKKRGKKKKKN